MNLVGYTATALSRNDIEDTPTNKNVVDFAIVELKDLQGNLVVMYDDAEGANPETQKICDTNGQVDFFAEIGDYNLEINGKAQRINLSSGLAEFISTKTDESVQQFIDTFALKIFQSPTDGGLTEIQTRTANANEVYEVRKTSDNSLATIYSDAAGTTEIVQNGTSNVSGSDGVVEFFAVGGSFYVDVGGVRANFKSFSHSLLLDLNAGGGHDAIYDRKLDSISDALVYTKAFSGLVVIIKDRPEAKFKYVLASSVTVDGYNIIQCSSPISTLALQRINYQITDLHGETVFGSELQNLNIVITGDSLSFNGYGYPASWGVSGTGYATDQWFGLSSWSHLVRDFIVSSNPAFKSIFDLNWYSSGGVVGRGITVEDERYFGMNGRVITFNFPNSTSKVIIEANSGLSIGLLVSTTTEDFAYKFSVDGVEHDNVTDYPDNYFGGGYKVIPCGADPVITNVRRYTTGATGGEFSIYGITSSTAGGSNAKYPMITGKGGYTSTQVLAEYSTLVAPYLPDVVFYMIGANDIDSGVPVATFKSNVEQFIDLVRASSPNAKVILLTTTPVARPPWVDGQERPYIEAMQEICNDKYCYLVNVFDEFRNIDPFYWRIDNTHFNKRGNDMMFNLVKDKIMPALPVDHNKFTPLREFYSGLLGLDGKRDQLTNYIEVTCTGTTPTITTAQNVNFKDNCSVAYVADGANTLLRVTLPDGYRLSSAESMHLNISDPSDELKVKTSSGGIVDIFRTSSGAIAPINGYGSKIRLSAGRFFGNV